MALLGPWQSSEAARDTPLAPCSPHSQRGTAQRVIALGCRMSRCRHPRSLVSQAPQRAPHSGHSTGWPLTWAILMRGSSLPPLTSRDPGETISHSDPSPIGLASRSPSMSAPLPIGRLPSVCVLDVACHSPTGSDRESAQEPPTRFSEESEFFALQASKYLLERACETPLRRNSSKPILSRSGA
mgnify:CR=1 FL=1